MVCTKAGVARRRCRPRRHLPAGLLASLDASLHRLRIDHVDLWLVHGWNAGGPLEETLSALEQAVTTGRARYVGVSNYTGWQTARRPRTSAAGSGGRSARGRWWPPRWSTPWCSAASSARSCRRPRALGARPARLVTAGPRRAHRQVPHGTPADSRAASPHLSGFVAPYLDGTSRRIVDAVVTAGRRAWGARRWRWLWPGSATGPGWRPPSSAPVPRPSCEASLASEEVELPDEIRTRARRGLRPAGRLPGAASPPLTV